MSLAPDRAPSGMSALARRLDLAEAARVASGRERTRRVRSGPTAATIVDGRAVVSFCSNDYLGLASDPQLAEAAARCMARLGTGSGASALVAGYTDAHAELEHALARLARRAAALVFPSGYHANLGLLGALARRGDTCYADRLCHASLVDGILLARSHLRRYRHADADSLATLLEAHRDGLPFVVTDAVFSMDGDLAPLGRIAALAARQGAVPIVDDAHGVGVLGDTGGGTSEALGLDESALPLLVGTLGKAFGAAGAFVAGPAAVIEALRQHARTYAFTTALPPPMAAAASAAIGHPEAAARRARVHALTERFRRAVAAAGVPALPSLTPIQPIPIGDSARAAHLSERLFERGFHCAAIRPPTVPEGTARLRVTLTAAHREDEVDGLVAALAAII